MSLLLSQFASPAHAPERFTYFQTDSIFLEWNVEGPPAPPPSPKLHAVHGPQQMNMGHVDQQIELHMSPLRQVISADDVDAIDEEDNEEDDVTITSHSNPPSSRCSEATLLSDAVGSRKRFTLPTRCRNQQRPSTSAGEESQYRRPISGRHISFPVIDSCTVAPDIVTFPSALPSSKTQSFPERGSYYPSRPKPEIPIEVRSGWFESDDEEVGEKKKKNSSTQIQMSTSPRRGRRFRCRLWDLFCGF